MTPRRRRQEEREGISRLVSGLPLEAISPPGREPKSPRLRSSSVGTVQPAQSVIQCTLQFIRRTRDGFVEAVRFRCDGNRLMTFKACFHHAALVPAPGLLPIRVAEVNFDAGNVLRQVAEGTRDRGLSPLGQCFATRDVMVGIDLDGHNFFPPANS